MYNTSINTPSKCKKLPLMNSITASCYLSNIHMCYPTWDHGPYIVLNIKAQMRYYYPFNYDTLLAGRHSIVTNISAIFN